MLRRHFLAVLILMLCSTTVSWAQQAYGSISGRITDPSGSVIPNVPVIVTNAGTNSISRVATNDTGYFEANLLNPGLYTVSVEAPGFKKALRSGLDVQVASHLDVDFLLQVGTAAETVEVTGAAPLLETTSASGGRVIDNRQIMQLPFSDMNPFALATLAAGMQWTGQPEYRRPFDNGGTSSFNTAGGVGSNEYTIDGAPATGTGRRVGFVPPSDAVDEFKLETANFDAASGHTSGATINVSTKSGSNAYHGSLYDQHWQQRWNATQHFTRLAFEDAVRSGKAKPDDQRQGPGRSNNFGGTLGGRIKIPKLYDGRDKLFFFVSYNGIYQSKAETTDSVNRSVPKLAWRQGDFSDLLAIDPVKYTIYDPRTARVENGHVVRSPFPGNKGIPVLNPMYSFYEKLYPKPNNVPGLVTPEGANNYLAVAMPKNEKFNSLVNRLDYNFSEKHRIFARWYWNHRLADEYDWTYETARGLHANGLTRINKGIGGDYLWSINSSTILDIGVNASRFNEGSVSPVRTGFKPTDVGLPAYLDAKAGALHELPRINFSNLESISDSYPAIGTRGTTGEFKADMTSTVRSHTLKYGYSERRYWYTAAGPGNSSGSFTFNNAYTRAADNTTTASNTGLEWAAFMLGLPSGISIDTNDSAFWTTPWRALYLQDQWRLSSRLTLNMGLRYEREGGTRERFNRGLASFDPSLKLPITDAGQAAYAASPLKELPAAQFQVLGGTQYLGKPDSAWTNGVHHFMPRIGAAYQLNSKTVLRAGYGTYYDTFNVNNDRPGQDGYSQPTNTTLTDDNGLTFYGGVGAIAGLSSGKTPLSDPFPVRADGTRFDAPYGNQIGSLIRAGRGYSFVPRTYDPAFQQRWRIGVQRQIRNDMVIEVAYSGSRARIPVSQRLDYLPSQYWATGTVRNQALDDDLNANVANPFNIKNLAGLQASQPLLYKYLSTVAFFTSGTIRKHQLLRLFPQMNGLNGLRPGVDYKDARGIVKYGDLQVQFEKRFARGFQTSVLYTYASSEASDFYANEFDAAPSFRVNNNTRPHRFVWTGIYELPFGKGKPLVNSGFAQHIAGGWQVSWVYQRQSGPATGWGNRFFYGDINNIGALFKHDEVNGKDIHQWFDPGIAFRGTGPIPAGFQGFEGRSSAQPGSYQVRIFPTRLDVLREDGIRNWDAKIQRRFHIHEQLYTSFSVDLLNATNHTNFSGPNTDPTSTNFGKVTSQRGLSRIIQFNLRVDF